jgi:hypothetical protein
MGSEHKTGRTIAMRLALRILLIANLWLLLSSVAQADSLEYGPPSTSLPGNSDQMRWDFLKNHLQLLCKSDKAQVKKLLGVGGWSYPERRTDRVIWAYRITSNLSKEAFADEFYELLISFEKDKVSSVEIHLKRRTVGYSGS